MGFFLLEWLSCIQRIQASVKQNARMVSNPTPIPRSPPVSSTFPPPLPPPFAPPRRYILKTVHSGNALVGTCRMGASAQDGSVVSSQDMTVFGVKGLRWG